MKKCKNCGSKEFTYNKGALARSYIMTEWVTLKGRMNLCGVCAKHAVETDQVFSMRDMMETWINGNRSEVIEAIARFPRWVTARFAVEMALRCGVNDAAVFSNLLEMHES